MDSKQTYGVFQRQKINRIDIKECEKRNPKTQELVNVRKGKCVICGRVNCQFSLSE